MPTPILLVTALFLGACVASDLRSRRIPNVLCLGGLLLGLGLNVVSDGWSGALSSLIGFAVAILLLLPVFAVGGIGGGDVKMVGALGALLGSRLMLMGLVWGMVAGGVFMLVHLWRHGRMREKLESTRFMLIAALQTRSLEPLRAPANDPAAIALPYSVPLGLGTLLALSGRLWVGS